MTQDRAVLYDAYVSRDARFDGVFFVGVTSTGIYCRPVCTAKTPKAENCRFFMSAAAAEQAAFRPCLRCRPELAPGSAPVDGAHRLARRVVDRISAGLPRDGAALERIAAEFHFSSRQMRRVVRQELGVSPIELVQTRRLLLAKQLLTDTRLPVTEVAYASGFSSLRRFNDAFLERYRMPPTRLRKEATESNGAPSSGREADLLTLQLSYRPPFDWPGLLSFLSLRALEGVESVADGEYRRTVRLGHHEGWLRVRHVPRRHALEVDLTPLLTPALPVVLSRLQGLFDLNARPDLISDKLRRDAVLAEAVARSPGLRVPGTFDGFELAVRAILGQQVSVKAAARLAGRFAASFGEPVETPRDELTHFGPSPERVAAADPDEIAALGIVRTRARSIVTLAQEVASGRLALDGGAHPEQTMARLVALPGIGPWTAHYIAMRALRWPDAFPKEDAVLRQRLGGVSPARAEAMSHAWRPWRSYATLHLWRLPRVAGASMGSAAPE